jgi:hypothetical protein
VLVLATVKEQFRLPLDLLVPQDQS